MKYVYVTRRARFNAAHKLWNDNWSEEKNLEVFGKCANPNWHGHNYELHVTLKGVPSEETGYCIDLKDLKDIIKEFPRHNCINDRAKMIWDRATLTKQSMMFLRVNFPGLV